MPASSSTCKPAPTASSSVHIDTARTSDVARMSSALGIKFRCLFESLSPLLVEGVLTFHENGASIRSTNLIIACEVTFDGRDGSCTKIEDFVFNGTKPISVGISFEEAQTCLSAVGPSDIVSFRLLRKGLDSSRPYMLLDIVHPSNSYQYSFKLPLLCLENIARSIPKIEFQKVVSIGSSLFLKILRTCSKRGDSVQIKTIRNGSDFYIAFVPYAENRAQGVFKVRFDTNDEEKEVVCDKLDLYSLKYLLLISKCANLSSTISIYLKKQSVLGLCIRVGVIGSAFFALAPKKNTAHANTHEAPPMLRILEDAKFMSTIKSRKKSAKRKAR